LWHSRCARGIESSLSGWLATYSHRADPLVAGGAAVSTALFWFGIMLTLVFSTRLLAIIGRRRLLGHLCGVAASIALLILTQQTTTIRVGSGLAGLSIGPLYRSCFPSSLSALRADGSLL